MEKGRRRVGALHGHGLNHVSCRSRVGLDLSLKLVSGVGFYWAVILKRPNLLHERARVLICIRNVGSVSF